MLLALKLTELNQGMKKYPFLLFEWIPYNLNIKYKSNLIGLKREAISRSRKLTDLNMDFLLVLLLLKND